MGRRNRRNQPDRFAVTSKTVRHFNNTDRNHVCVLRQERYLLAKHNLTGGVPHRQVRRVAVGDEIHRGAVLAQRLAVLEGVESQLSPKVPDTVPTELVADYGSEYALRA